MAVFCLCIRGWPRGMPIRRRSEFCLNPFKTQTSSQATVNKVIAVSRSYSIVPAAGRSRRMGRPKLLLPWGNWTLIDQLLQAWTDSAVDHTVVVVRADDDELRAACSRWPVHVVRPLNPPQDMKESVQIGLRFLEQRWQPKNEDRCFVAPADLPGLTSRVINRLIEANADPAAVTIPHFGKRQGHPALLAWPVTQQIFDLPDDLGINQVMKQNPRHVVSFPGSDYFGDVDTQDEYRRSLPEQKRFPD